MRLLRLGAFGMVLAALWLWAQRLPAQDDEREGPFVERVESTRPLQEKPVRRKRSPTRQLVVRENEPGRYPRRWHGLEIRSVSGIDAALRRRLDERDMATLDDVLAQSGADYLAIVAHGPGDGARLDSLAAEGLASRFVPLLYVREGRASSRSYVVDIDLSKETGLHFEPVPGQCPAFQPLGRIVSAGALEYGSEARCRVDRVDRYQLELLCLPAATESGIDQWVMLKVVAWADVNHDGLEDVVLVSESCGLFEHGYCDTDVFVATRRSEGGSFEVLERWHPLRFAKLAAADGALFCGQAVLPTTYDVTCGQDCVGDIEPLRAFPDITRLDLRGSGVHDLAGVTALTRLELLFLDGTRVTDLTPLSGLKSLKTLTLAGTGVRDVSALSTLSSLENLDLSRTKVTDLSPLIYLRRLRTVKFSGVVPPQLKARVERADTPADPLESDCCEYVPADARRVSLADEEPATVWTVHGIERIEHIEELDLSRTNVADLTPLAKLKHLRTLNVSHTPVADLTPLAGMTSLEELDLRGTRVRALEALRTLTNLRVLWVDKVESLQGLEGATKLEELVLSDCPVTDLSPIAAARGLRTLHVDGTAVTSLDVLAGLTALQRIDLSRTTISSIAGLAAAKSLRSVSLVGTPVSDLSPLHDRSALERLDLGFSSVRSLDSLGAPAALRLLDLRGLKLASSRGFTLPPALAEVDVDEARINRALEARFTAAGVRLVKTKNKVREFRNRPW
jgi:Leucine-rich repeat (LRR) protein